MSEMGPTTHTWHDLEVRSGVVARGRGRCITYAAGASVVRHVSWDVIYYMHAR